MGVAHDVVHHADVTLARFEGRQRGPEGMTVDQAGALAARADMGLASSSVT